MYDGRVCILLLLKSYINFIKQKIFRGIAKGRGYLEDGEDHQKLFALKQQAMRETVPSQRHIEQNGYIFETSIILKETSH